MTSEQMRFAKKNIAAVRTVARVTPTTPRLAGEIRKDRQIPKRGEFPSLRPEFSTRGLVPQVVLPWTQNDERGESSAGKLCGSDSRRSKGFPDACRLRAALRPVAQAQP